jgi:3-oxoacyl-[acyl-carrier protein] reductase
MWTLFAIAAVVGEVGTRCTQNSLGIVEICLSRFSGSQRQNTERSMFNSLAGRTAVVTGASKGIGRGIARRLGEVGCSVLVVARNKTESEIVAREITEAKGKASAFSADVRDETETKAMAAAAIERYGSLDILCANAGVFAAAKLDVMSGSEFDDVLATNLRGTFLTVRACLPALKQAKGRIVVTSSITGPITGYPGWSHYGASKAGQLGFIRTAAIELAPAGVTINAVMPGNIATEGLSGLGPDYIAKMQSSIPMRRLGTVEDVANAVLFFASDEACYITGQTLIIDGGQTLPESLMALEEMSK